jgi:hypothetical protein
MEQMRDVWRFRVAMAWLLAMGAGSLCFAVPVGALSVSNSGPTTAGTGSGASETGGATVPSRHQGAYRERGPRPGMHW